MRVPAGGERRNKKCPILSVTFERQTHAKALHYVSGGKGSQWVRASEMQQGGNCISVSMRHCCCVYWMTARTFFRTFFTTTNRKKII
jgi:hypothetical protein